MILSIILTNSIIFIDFVILLFLKFYTVLKLKGYNFQNFIFKKILNQVNNKTKHNEAII
jgi:hypothetical protein